MSKEWQLYKDGQSYGPYTEEQMEQFVRDGRILPADLVWNGGMEQWIPAEQASFFAAQPAHYVPNSPTPRPGSSASGLKIVGLILTSIILFFAGWAYQGNLGLERTILNANYYRSLFQEVGVASMLHQGFRELMIPAAATTAGMPGTPPGDISQVDTLVAEAFSEEWIEEQLLLIIDDYLAVMKGEQQTFTAVLDLREVKDKLMQGQDAELQMLYADLPDQLPLQDIMGADAEMWEELQEEISSIHQSQRIYNFAQYIFFAFLLLCCFLMAGPAGALKWFGSATLFSGVTFWGMLQVGDYLVASLFPPEIAEFQLIVEHLFSSISRLSLIYAAVGLALLTGGIIWGILKKPKLLSS